MLVKLVTPQPAALPLSVFILEVWVKGELLDEQEDNEDDDDDDVCCTREERPLRFDLDTRQTL